MKNADITTVEKELNINLDTIKSRLEYLNSATPFEIEQTPILINTIVSYLKKRQKTYKTLFYKSRYYFPIFENSLQKYFLRQPKEEIVKILSDTFVVSNII